MHTILVPVDGSEHALKALQIAGDLADKYGGRVVLLHVLADARKASELLGLAVAKDFDRKLRSALEAASRKPPGLAPANVQKAAGEQVLAHAVERVRRRGLKVEVLALESGDPAEAILLAHQRTGAGTIVMGCRGVSGTDASPFGSVSHKVFQRAECTCLSVK